MKVIFKNYEEIYQQRFDTDVDTTFCFSDTTTRECPSDGIPNCDDERLGTCRTYCRKDDD